LSNDEPSALAHRTAVGDDRSDEGDRGQACFVAFAAALVDPEFERSRRLAGTTIARYYFDGEGKRVKKKLYDPLAPTVVKEETIFVYSSGKLIAEYSTAPTPPALAGIDQK